VTQAGGRHSNPLRYLRSSATVKSPTQTVTQITGGLTRATSRAAL